MTKPRAKPSSRSSAPTVRCAAYTRQSVADSLEFHSVLAQRDAIQAFVRSRASEGWILLPQTYDDRGFSGKNTDRPGFQQLVREIEAGLVDAVVVHRLDRISRSVQDLTRFIGFLDERGVGFCCVTQSIDTKGSTGRLLLHVLAAVAEFERQITSERTKAKFVAARQRGLWVTGRPPLGYDFVNGELVVNEAEAATANEVFGLYLRCGSLRATIAELDRRGINTKLNTSKAGARFGGSKFRKQSLAHTLANPVYVGKLRSGDEVLAGRHTAIIEQSVFDAVQAKLAENARSTNSEHRNRYGALLRGIAYCGVCGSPMRHDITTRHGRAYRYYTCALQQTEGAKACPGSRAPGSELEQFVLDRIRGVGTDPRVFEAAVAATRAEADTLRPALIAQTRRLEAERRRLDAERAGLLAAAAGNPGTAQPALTRVAEIDAGLPALDARLAAARDELTRLDARALDLGELRERLTGFDALFEQLTVAEQCRLVALIIERVDVDVPKAAIRVTFRGAAPSQPTRTTA